jgi:hypothetical protein
MKCWTQHKVCETCAESQPIPVRNATCDEFLLSSEDEDDMPAKTQQDDEDEGDILAETGQDDEDEGDIFAKTGQDGDDADHNDAAMARLYGPLATEHKCCNCASVVKEGFHPCQISGDWCCAWCLTVEGFGISSPCFKCASSLSPPPGLVER